VKEVDTSLESDTSPHRDDIKIEAHDPSETVNYEHFIDTSAAKVAGSHKLKMPTLEQLLAASFKERKYLLSPWLREQENCMVYAATGVGKSLFAMSAALAIAGGGEFLGWRPDARSDGTGWRVLYVDGEMHIGDIQERARQLRNGMPKLDRTAWIRTCAFSPVSIKMEASSFRPLRSRRDSGSSSSS
jgi:hypothetical protein